MWMGPRATAGLPSKSGGAAAGHTPSQARFAALVRDPRTYLVLAALPFLLHPVGSLAAVQAFLSHIVTLLTEGSLATVLALLWVVLLAGALLLTRCSLRGPSKSVVSSVTRLAKTATGTGASSAGLLGEKGGPGESIRVQDARGTNGTQRKGKSGHGSAPSSACTAPNVDAESSLAGDGAASDGYASSAHSHSLDTRDPGNGGDCNGGVATTTTTRARNASKSRKGRRGRRASGSSAPGSSSAAAAASSPHSAPHHASSSTESRSVGTPATPPGSATATNFPLFFLDAADPSSESDGDERARRRAEKSAERTRQRLDVEARLREEAKRMKSNKAKSRKSKQLQRQQTTTTTMTASTAAAAVAPQQHTSQATLAAGAEKATRRTPRKGAGTTGIALKTKGSAAKAQSTGIGRATGSPVAPSVSRRRSSTDPLPTIGFASSGAEGSGTPPRAPTAARNQRASKKPAVAQAVQPPNKKAGRRALTGPGPKAVPAASSAPMTPTQAVASAARINASRRGRAVGGAYGPVRTPGSVIGPGPIARRTLLSEVVRGAANGQTADGSISTATTTTSAPTTGRGLMSAAAKPFAPTSAAGPTAAPPSPSMDVPSAGASAASLLATQYVLPGPHPSMASTPISTTFEAPQSLRHPLEHAPAPRDPYMVVPSTAPYGVGAPDLPAFMSGAAPAGDTYGRDGARHSAGAGVGAGRLHPPSAPTTTYPDMFGSPGDVPSTVRLHLHAPHMGPPRTHEELDDVALDREMYSAAVSNVESLLDDF